MSESALDIRELGLTPYEEAWRLQRELQQKLLSGQGAQTLVLCEHPSVITLGRSAARRHIVADERELAARGVKVYEVERGGDVTWHGPGQLVCYPIIDLNQKRRDVRWYVRGLEEVVIRALAHFGLEGARVEGRSGVWIAPGNECRKISSLGVRISRWRTLHGFALNVKEELDGFGLIEPCGLYGVRMTSMEEELRRRGASRELVIGDVTAVIIEQFRSVFDYH